MSCSADLNSDAKIIRTGVQGCARASGDAGTAAVAQVPKQRCAERACRQPHLVRAPRDLRTVANKAGGGGSYGEVMKPRDAKGPKLASLAEAITYKTNQSGTIPRIVHPSSRRARTLQASPPQPFRRGAARAYGRGNKTGGAGGCVRVLDEHVRTHLNAVTTLFSRPQPPIISVSSLKFQTVIFPPGSH